MGSTQDGTVLNGLGQGTQRTVLHMILCEVCKGAIMWIPQLSDVWLEEPFKRVRKPVEAVEQDNLKMHQ